ncbi:MAG: putative transport system permease protein [Actinomycetota bacterium]|jgi:putative ABC transport system permease protein|nr:putative transport system permease protein [Actinomycetota bacterium]
MLRATLRSLLARKLRLVLSGIAVILGVAFVSGTFVLTDSMGRVFDNLFATVSKGTAVNVRGVSALGNEGDTSGNEPVPQSVLDAVKKVDGVAEVAGQISGYAQAVDKKGKAVTTGGAPTFGVEWTPSPRQRALTLKQGRPPAGPTEVAIDAGTARKAGFHVGDTVTILLKGPARQFTLVGIVGFGTTDNLAGATIAAFDVASAQNYVGTRGTYTDLAIAGESGVSQKDLAKRVSAVLPKGFEAVTQQQQTDEASKAIKNGLGFFSTALLVFAAIALFVGAFLIFNTFSMLIAQRTRELALMRSLGASRRQITVSVLVEALIVGLFSSVVGFVLGIGVAKGLNALLGALGIDLPSGETVIATRTVVASLVVGVGVTCAAALLPARKAARVAPVEALRESGPAEDRSLRRRGLVGAALTLAGVGLLALGLSNGTLKLVGLGAAASFLGVATLSPFIARPITSALGLPFAKFGVPGKLGRGNAMRSPRRTSATAAALMVGLALVAAVSVLGSSLKSSTVKIVDTSLGADYILHTENFTPFSGAVGKDLEGKPGIASVASFRFGEAKVGKSTSPVQGVEPEALAEVLKLKPIAGKFADMGTGLAISKKVAKDHGWKVGDTVPVTWRRTGLHPLKVAVIYDINQFAGDYLVSGTTFDANTSQQLLGVVAVKTKPGAKPKDTRAVVDAAAKPFPNIVVQDQSEFVKSQGKQIDQLLNAITGLLVLSVLIAVLGIINTLALSVIERTRELGLLRAVGLQRRQLRRMIRVESVVIAVYGALLGLGVGVAFGWALVRALHGQGVTEFALPYGRLVQVLIVAALAGVLAAALPARRAARLDVLEAVAST